MTESDPVGQVRGRFDALTPDRQTALALACAEHLVCVMASEREEELRQALKRGWDSLNGTELDLAPLREQFERRDDLDDDEVASTCFALGAADGQADHAWWAVARAWDAAYERVPYPPGQTVFVPNVVDTAHQEVQDELAWQLGAVSVLERAEPLSALVERLRS